MVLCGFCLAQDPVKRPEPELPVETEVVPEVDPNPMADGKTSASEMSAYFDGIFGGLGNWLAYAFSDNRPIESGNLSSSMVFMSGERAASLGDQNAYNGRRLPGVSGLNLNSGKPLVDLHLPEGNEGPRIEIKSGKDKDSTAEGVVNDSVFRHSKAAIDRYFTANVIHPPKGPVNASRRPGSLRSKMSVKAFRSVSASNPAAASLAMQAVPEPSSILFCGFAAVICACFRRRPDLS